MKKKLLIIVVIILVVIFANPLFYIYGLPVIYEKIEDIKYNIQYRDVENTPLGNENIMGFTLNQNYDPQATAKQFGEADLKIEADGFDTYEYTSEEASIDFKVDKNNKIIAITISGDKNDVLKTSNGITINSTQFEIIQAYGDHYIKKKIIVFMGQGEYYSVTYADKNSGYLLDFEFNKYEDSAELISITFKINENN